MVLHYYLDDPERWTVTAGLLLTVPLKLVTGADLDSPLNPLENPVTGVDSPLMAASMAASISGPKVLITYIDKSDIRCIMKSISPIPQQTQHLRRSLFYDEIHSKDH